MKKILVVLLFLATFTLTACGSSEKKVDLNKTQKVTIGELSAEVPTAFEKSDQSSEDLMFYDIKDYDYDLSVCSLTFDLDEVYKYGDSIEEELGREFSSEFFQPSTINKTTLNGREWTIAEAKSLEKDGGYYLKGMYVTDYNNKRYTFEYTNYVAEKISCATLVQKIANSLKFQ